MDDNITISTLDKDTITIYKSSLTSSMPSPYLNYSIGTTTPYTTTPYTTPYITRGSFATTSNPSTFHVQGDAEFEGDVKIKGVSLAKTLEDINSRLAILVPDPAKLEHFEALKKAYDHYKVLEALCELPTKNTTE